VQSEADTIRAYFDAMLNGVLAAKDGRNAYDINSYHTQCRGLYDIVTEPRIVEAVADLIGPDVVCWGSHFFCKLPHDPTHVPWHQDSSYWPLRPNRTVTAWLAIDDADAENAAMRFIPGTHRALLPAGDSQGRVAAGLNISLRSPELLGSQVVDALKAGDMSLHADLLAHGSPANGSARRRCGLTIRYCPPSVRPNGWGGASVLVAGSDPHGNWSHRGRPDGEDLSPQAWQLEQINAR
jgi:non-heme Fe2+,alpha-ketoglutarate-dependent halogenase